MMRCMSLGGGGDSCDSVAEEARIAAAAIITELDVVVVGCRFCLLLLLLLWGMGGLVVGGGWFGIQGGEACLFGDDYAATRWYLDINHVPSGRDGTGRDGVPSFCCDLGWMGGWGLDLDFWMTDYWDALVWSLLFWVLFLLAFNDGRHALFGIFVCRRGGRAFLLMRGWLGVGLHTLIWHESSEEVSHRCHWDGREWALIWAGGRRWLCTW